MTRRILVVSASVAWLVGFGLSFTMLCPPPASWPLGLAAIALIPVGLGSRQFRIFGTVAVLLSLFFALGAHQARLRRKAPQSETQGRSVCA